MRQKIIAGNWKMNLDRNGAAELAAAIVAGVADDEVLVVLCPPSIYMEAVVEETMGSPVVVGAQNTFYEEEGAFTGELSPQMFADIGCQFAILGHSERRQIMGETDQIINLKVHAAIEAGLRPLVCIGETLEERESGSTEAVIRRQFSESLAGLDEEAFAHIVIAYEPVWAIGTGKVATPNQAESVHSDLRKMIENCYNSRLAEQVSILYGGSVNSENAAALLAQPNIDGALVGGASLKAGNFLAIVRSC